MVTLLYLVSLAGLALCAPEDFFGGIPFAEPPLGQLRLKAPVSKFTLNDDDVFDASNFGSDCLQLSNSSPVGSEDCLTINILRPSGTRANSSLPVLFWTYGGGFFAGKSSTFNGSAIVAQSVLRGTPIIYVNFNYRLGPLGFPEGNEANLLGELNLGIKDQITALEWVQANIQVFGGDKSKVTIFGESAGSIMTAVLFLNPSISQLARGAIFESGSAASSLTFGARPRQDSWEDFVTGIPSCEQLATTTVTFDCIRRANTSEVIKGLERSLAVADEAIPFGPTLDGPQGLFPDFPSLLFSEGRFARIPFIAGTNLDEGTSFVPRTINLTEDEEKAYLTANFSPPGIPGTLLDRLFELYPNDLSFGAPHDTGNETFGLSDSFKRMAGLAGDLSFDSQRRLLSQAAANAGVKTYGYLFEQRLLESTPFFGVTHGNEIPFVYGALPENETASANALSRVMIDYWISFTSSLDPNDGLGVEQPHERHRGDARALIPGLGVHGRARGEPDIREEHGEPGPEKLGTPVDALGEPENNEIVFHDA
ncbi:alpha/beta-hydrolase [Hymenopellis radicata]|nr:alpha/beta-hydrolase [Hymenopellis radicata]